MKPWMLILTGVFAGLIAGALIFILVAPPRGNPVTLLPEPTRAPITVHLDGAVAHPGLYQLPAGSRLQDGVEAAGGLTSRANAGSLNLAERLEDGEKLLIPALLPTAAVTPGSRANEIPLVQPTSDGRVDLNQGTMEQFDSLPGIGEAKARSILEYRQKNGPFKKIEDIMNVPGIGTGIFEAIKEFIYVTSNQP